MKGRMMMDCRQVKSLLPLWVGQDLPDSSTTADVAKHLEQCPECAKRQVGLQSSLEVLQSCSADTLSTESPSRSVWPQLVHRISTWESLHHRERFNGWIPASVMSLAVALMIAVSLPSIRDEFFREPGNQSNLVDLFEFASDLNSDNGIDASTPVNDSIRSQRPAVGTAVIYRPEQW